MSEVSQHTLSLMQRRKISHRVHSSRTRIQNILLGHFRASLLRKLRSVHFIHLFSSIKIDFPAEPNDGASLIRVACEIRFRLSHASFIKFPVLGGLCILASFMMLMGSFGRSGTNNIPSIEPARFKNCKSSLCSAIENCTRFVFTIGVPSFTIEAFVYDFFPKTLNLTFAW